MKTTEQIDRISKISISSYRDSWIFIDSDELDLTGKMRVSEFLKFISAGAIVRALKFDNGKQLAFDNGNLVRIST